jgi:hypothetical protein
MPWLPRLSAAVVVVAVAIWVGGEIRDRLELNRLTADLDGDDPAARDRAALLLIERRRAERLPDWAAERLFGALVHVEPSVEPESPTAGQPVVFRCRVRTDYALPLAVSCRGVVELDGRPTLELTADNVIPPEAPRRVYESVSAPVAAFVQPGEYTVLVSLIPSRAERERLGATLWDRPLRSRPIRVSVRRRRVYH